MIHLGLLYYPEKRFLNFGELKDIKTILRTINLNYNQELNSSEFLLIANKK